MSPNLPTVSYRVNNDVLALWSSGIEAGHVQIHEDPLVLDSHHLLGLLGGLRRVVRGQQP